MRLAVFIILILGMPLSVPAFAQEEGGEGKLITEQDPEWDMSKPMDSGIKVKNNPGDPGVDSNGNGKGNAFIVCPPSAPLDPATNTCRATPKCGEHYTYSEEEKRCVLNQPDCPEGMYFDHATGGCSIHEQPTVDIKNIP